MPHHDLKPAFLERRRSPRVNKRIEFQIESSAPEFRVWGRTRNLSCIGALCEFNRVIPEMTHFRIELQLADQIASCEGTVVRVEKHPERDGMYDVAIYFNEIKPTEQQKIADFLDNAS